MNEMTVQKRVKVAEPLIDYSHLGAVCSDWRSSDHEFCPFYAGEERIPVTIVTGSSTAEREVLIEQIFSKHSQSYFISVVEQGLPRGNLKKDLEFLYNKLTRPSKCTSHITCINKHSPPILKVPSMYNCVKSVKKHAVIISLHTLADPLPILQTFYLEDCSFQLKFRLNAVATVLDCHRVAQAVSSNTNAIYATPMLHLQASIADRIFLHNEMPLCVDQESVERMISEVYPIPILRMDSDTENRNTLLELDLCDLDHLDDELSRCRGTKDTVVGLSVPSTSLFQRSWNTSFQLPGDLSMDLCSRWMEQCFLADDVIRYQGVFSIKGKHEKYVFHGVRGGMWSGGFSASYRWNHQERVNHFVAVVIPNGGTTTERVKELAQTLNACLAPKLRFGLGEVVQVMIGKKWQGGRVVGLWDEGNPYCVQLKLDRKEVLVPHDEDSFVRKRPKHVNSKKLKNRPN